MTDNGRHGMTSVDKALQVLVMLGDSSAVRVMDVAAQLGIARSSAHRILTALLQRDFVTQDADLVYRRGPAFERAGFGPWRGAALRIALHRHLEALTNRTGETSHLVVLAGNSARFIDGVESDQILSVRSRTGMLLPAHTTAAGKVLLAGRSAAELDALYPFGLPGALPGDPGDIARRRELRRELATVRRRDYATNIEQTERGVVAVAVALRDSAGRAHASIALACPSARCPRSRLEGLAGQVRTTASAARTDLDAILDRDSATANSAGKSLPAPGSCGSRCRGIVSQRCRCGGCDASRAPESDGIGLA
jgi:DNA-binding IclR family transcriptional regulator